MILNALSNEPTTMCTFGPARVLAVAGGPTGPLSNPGVAAQ